MSENEDLVLGAVRLNWSTAREIADRVLWPEGMAAETRVRYAYKYLDRAADRGRIEREEIMGRACYRLHGPSRSEESVKAMLTGAWTPTRAIADSVPVAEWASEANHIGWVRRTLESLARYGVAERRETKASGRTVLEWRLRDDPVPARRLRRYEGRPYADDIRRVVISCGPIPLDALLAKLGVDPLRKGTVATVKGYVRRETQAGRFVETDGGIAWGPSAAPMDRLVRDPGLTSERIRDAISEQGPLDIMSLADIVGVHPVTVRRHLRTMGAVEAGRDGRTVLWGLRPDEAEDDEGDAEGAGDAEGRGEGPR